MKNFFPALVVLALFVLTVPSVQAGETVCDGNTCRIVNRPILHAGAVAVTAPITHPPTCQATGCATVQKAVSCKKRVLFKRRSCRLLARKRCCR